MRRSKSLRLVLGLEQEGGAQDDQLVHRDARRRVRVIEGALFLGEQLAQRHRAGGHVEHLLAGADALERSRAHEPARHRIHLDLEGRRAAKLRVDGGRVHRAQLDDRVGVPPWIRRARTTTPARFKARSGVSKKNACRGCASTGSSPMLLIVARWPVSGHRQLQFDAGRPFDELEDFDHVLAREWLRQCGLTSAFGSRFSGRYCLRGLRGLCARRGLRGFCGCLGSHGLHLFRYKKQKLVSFAGPSSQRNTPFRLRTARPARRGAGRGR